jgi:WD40 repeat protein
MNVEVDRATFTWSEGPASFEPYVLDGMNYKDFQEVSANARNKLEDLVRDYFSDPQYVSKSALTLADTRLATGTGDGKARLYDTQEYDLLLVIDMLKIGVVGVAWAPDGSHLAVWQESKMWVLDGSPLPSTRPNGKQQP